MNFLFSFSRIKGTVFLTILCVLGIPRFDFKEGFSKRGGTFFLPFAFRSVPQKGTFGKGEKRVWCQQLPFRGGGGGSNIFLSIYS